MSLSLYKSTLDFLISQSSIKAQGNHLRRLKTLSGMLCSCIKTKKSTLEGISSATEQSNSESALKQAKRWLDSKWSDWESFFAPYIIGLVQKAMSKGEIILVIDGSEVAGNCVTLMLSFIWGNYAIPLAWITREGKKGHFPEQMHLDLLKQVHPLFASAQRVILLGDGEFDGSKLRAWCNSNAWEFVLRTSKDHLVDYGDEIAPLSKLSPAEGHQFAFLEDATKGDHAIIWQGRGHSEPIFLLTNMDLGAMACRYYRKRFKIENLFKSMKSAGFNLHKSKVEGAQRVGSLILVVALAFVLTICVGFILKKQPKQVLKIFVRVDRVPKMSPILLAQKCLDKAFELAISFFLNLSKNWTAFFY
jgi:Transposase DDE domain